MSVLVHRCRFLDFTVSPLLALAQSSQKITALGRENGDIEILDEYYNQTMKLHHGDKHSVRCLLFVGSRLISAGFDSNLFAWDLKSVVPACTTSSFGGAVWSLCANESNIYAGCEDGSVRVFNHDLEYKFSFPGHKSRVTSLASYGNKIAAGDSTGTVRLFIDNKFDSSFKVSKNEESIIWSVLFVKNGTVLVLADSLCRTSFYDAIYGTPIAAFVLHDLPVTCLTSSPDQTIYSSGMDNKIVQFRFIENKWTPIASVRSHSHGVSSLLALPVTKIDDETPVLLSGGLDSLLCEYKAWSFSSSSHARGPTGKLKIRKISNSWSRCVVANPFVLFQGEQLQLWKLGKEGKEAELVSSLEMNCTASALSADCSMLVCCNQKKALLFKINHEGAIKLEKLSLGVPVADYYKFFKSILYFVNRSGLYSLNTESGETVQIAKDYLSHIEVSNNGKFVAGIVSDGRALIYKITGVASFELHAFAAFPQARITSIAFDPNSNVLACAATNRSFLIFDLSSKSWTDNSLQQLSSFPAQLLNQEDCIQHISFNPSNPEMLLLSAPSFMFSCSLNGKFVIANNNSVLKKRKLVKEKEETCRLIERYAPCAFSAFIDDDELVVLERPWVKLMKSLPDPIYRPTFGKK